MNGNAMGGKLGLTKSFYCYILTVPMRGRAEVARRAHNPEVSGSNPLPATNENRSPWGYGFLIGLRVDGYEKSLLGGFFDEP